MSNKHTLGSLNCIRTAPGTAPAHTIVCFHGFGANAEDLYGLHAHVRTPANTEWIFPDAILELAPGMPAPAPRAWFPIDEAALQYALERGSYRDMSGFAPPGMAAARDAAASCLRALFAEGVRADRLTLCGFSQGAMLATELTLRFAELFGAAGDPSSSESASQANTKAERPAGLAILSGTLLDAEQWRQLAASESLRGLQFFQSHGTRDPILAPDAARNLEALLRDAGWTGEFVEFPGGHEIPPPVIARLGQYLCR